MSNLGAIKVQLLNVRVAGKPTFMPSKNGDPRRHHTMVTVICNRGKNPNNQEDMTDEITLNFWGKYAIFAAKYLDTGREINVDGELRSYRHQTGQINPTSGKPVIERRVEVLVNRCFFGKDSMKELSARINANIAALRQSGRLVGDVAAEELLKVSRIDVGDYNPALHDASGIYGNARIWRGGWIGNGVAAPASTTDELAQLRQAVATMSAQLSAANAGASAEANPFEPAQ